DCSGQHRAHTSDGPLTAAPQFSIIELIGSGSGPGHQVGHSDPPFCEHALIRTRQSRGCVDGGFGDSSEVERRPEAISRSREGCIDGCGPRTRIDADDEEAHSSRTSLIVRIGKDVVTAAAAMADPFEFAADRPTPLQLRGRAPGTPVGGQRTHRFSLTIVHGSGLAQRADAHAPGTRTVELSRLIAAVVHRPPHGTDRRPSDRTVSTECRPTGAVVPAQPSEATHAEVTDLIAFDTTSRDSNLPLIDHVESRLQAAGITSQRI